MMLMVRDTLKIHVRLAPVDMRKAINGLTALIVDEFNLSPQSGHLFLFYNRKKDKVKIVYWDRNGFVLHYKRLERCRFKLSSSTEKDNIEITAEQLQWLLAGLDFQLMATFNEIDYTNYY